MNDFIRREDVIEALKLLTDEDDPYDEGYNLGLNTAILEVKKRIPSAEPKVGRWVYEECQRLIDETDEGQVFATEKKWHCSQCGFSKGFGLYRPNEKYCPNCGAKMEGE